MQSRILTETGDGKAKARTWLLVLETGEEVKKTLEDFAAAQKVAAASFIALGAFQRARIGYFQWDKKTYKNIPVEEQVEVITLTGDIVRGEKGGPSLHAHVVLGREDGSTRGGHLLEGIVRPTLEVTLTQSPAHLVRREHPELGIALIESA
jgi:predicted DNA-binding protein with PD1-like motif